MDGAGILFVVSAPSGAGKTTLVKMLLERDARVRHSVSYTTRAPRAGEQDGREYHFVDPAAFHAMRERGDFLESAEVHGNFYGTSRVWLEEQMRSGQDMLLEIDWQGARQVRRIFPAAVLVFILPPSIAELERRLRGRGQDAEEVIRRRVAAALGEMQHVGEFDFAIINNDLQEACNGLCAIVQSARLRVASQRARVPEMFRFLEQ
jgi:guanylate kinase